LQLRYGLVAAQVQRLCGLVVAIATTAATAAAALLVI
jgi:hypothetical protein